MAPTPTWWLAPAGSVLGPEGSHRVIKTHPGEALWNSKPSSAAGPASAALLVGTRSHTPRLPWARHASIDARSRPWNSPGEDGSAPSSTSTPL